MKLHRLTQLLAALALGGLIASVWLYGSYSARVLFGASSNDQFSIALYILLVFLNNGGISLALSAAVLLMLHFWQHHQRTQFASLLTLTMLLVVTQDSGIHDVLVPMLGVIPSGPPTAVSSALELALHCLPSAALALVVLAMGVVGQRGSPPAALGSQDDESLKMHVETVGE